MNRLVEVAPEVFRAAGAPESWEQRGLAVCLWLGEGTAISGQAAARVYGFDRFARVGVEVSTVNHKHIWTLGHPGGPGAPRIHRVDERLLSEIRVLDGLPVTSARRLIHDLAGRKHSRVERVLDAALRRELTSMADLWIYVEQDWMRGRRGVAIMRSLLLVRTTRRPSDSEAELEMQSIIDEYQLPAAVHQHPVALDGYSVHIDLAYPDKKLAIECDSYAWHMDRDAFERDRQRDIDLQALGWTVLRFTWTMLRYQRAAVAAAVKRARDAAPDPRRV